MHRSRHRRLHGRIILAATIAFAVTVPLAAWSADPTPDPPEPYLTGPPTAVAFERARDVSV
jgi:hypothetical protein